MPRSTKAEPKKAPTKRRTTKRSASEQRSCYEIPESPDSQREQKQADVVSATSSERSPARSNRGRSASTAPSTLVEDTEATPRQSKHVRPSSTSFDSRNDSVPGFEALEAVNGLYTKLKDTQAELQQLREEKEALSTLNHELDARVSLLQSEVKAEKDKVKKMQSAQNKEAESARKDAEERLNVVLSSLQGFGDAALRIMPLLDVLTGAADIEYDDDTEKLYQALKGYKGAEEFKTGGNIKVEAKRLEQ